MWNLEEENPDNPSKHYLHFHCKNWSPIVGLWDSLERWVLLFLRARISLGGTCLGAYLYLVAPISSKGVTSFVGQTCRWCFCCIGAGLGVKTKGLLLGKEEVRQGNSGLWWQAVRSAGGHTNSTGWSPKELIVSIFKATSLKMFFICVGHFKDTEINAILVLTAVTW